jgi:serine phosphatase RsbU (regulator of sigma subunit)
MHGSGHEFLAEPHGPLAGAFGDVHYTAGSRVLEPGAVLLCHTDGVTEAANAEQMQWGEVAYAEALAPLLREPLPALLDNMRAALARHTGDRALEDDCTLLALRRH